MEQTDYIGTIGGAVDCVRRARDSSNKVCLLIGAGCSKSAGIPLASEFVSIVSDRYGFFYDQALREAQHQRGESAQPNYLECMQKLPRGVRYELLAEFVDVAPINWSHICMALLMKQGYVDRILTTNFDPLIVRACSLVGVYPGVYDMAVGGENYNPEDIIDNAVLYLHGQRHGFNRVMTLEDTAQASYRDVLLRVFDDGRQKRSWIVIGYSGEEDAVFDVLADVKEFRWGLHWIGFRDQPPKDHLCKYLLNPGKHAYYVQGEDDKFNADSFFIEVARGLGLFPPAFMEKPFSHLKASLGTVARFPCDDEQSPSDASLSMIDKAISTYEERGEPPTEQQIEDSRDELDALIHLMNNDPERVVEAYDKESLTAGSYLADLVAQAHLSIGSSSLQAGEIERSRESSVPYYEGALRHIVRASELVEHERHSIGTRSNLDSIG